MKKKIHNEIRNNKSVMEESLDNQVEEQVMIELIIHGTGETEDSIHFHVDKKIVCASTFMSTILENDRSETRIELVLPKNITDPIQTMRWVIEFITYHTEYPFTPITKPLVSDNLLESSVCSWDNEFIMKSDQELVNLSLTANYLDIPNLLALCCAKIGAIMKSIIKQYHTKEEQMTAVKKRWHGADPTML